MLAHSSRRNALSLVLTIEAALLCVGYSDCSESNPLFVDVASCFFMYTASSLDSYATVLIVNEK